MAINKFKCEIVYSPTEIIWNLSGSLNEHAHFSPVDKSKSLTINFREITLVNSYGIRVWCKWMTENKDISSLTLEQCPSNFVNNFGLISGFITSKTTIKSFYVPFFNEESQERKDVLFNLGEDYQIGGFLKIPDVKDSKGEYMDLDVNPTKYFSFLNPKIKTN